MPVIDGRDAVVHNILRLVRGASILGVPALLTEQYVHGLGPTVEPVREAFRETIGYHPVEKMCFSACGSAQFMALLSALDRRQVLLAGAETHVCVHQTAIDLLAQGFEVQVIADAVSSRSAVNKDIALRRLQSEGVRLSSTEMALFELTGISGTDEFRAIARLVK